MLIIKHLLCANSYCSSGGINLTCYILLTKKKKRKTTKFTAHLHSMALKSRKDLPNLLKIKSSSPLLAIIILISISYWRAALDSHCPNSYASPFSF